MTINRHNYEEFFLLYVDNELPAAERKAVDVFVEENADLKAELQTLQEATLTPVSFVFDKSSLLKTTAESSLQEQLILLGDKELDKSSVAKLHQLMNSDAAAADEWHLLQQTRLVPDMSVVFPDKQSLYRKEAGRVVGMKWWRIAAAAVLLGFGIWGGVSMYNNSNESAIENPALAGTKGESKNDTGDKNYVAQNNDSNTINPATKDAQTNPSLATVEPAATNGSDKNAKSKSNNAAVNNVPAPETLIAQKPSNNLPKSYLENINNRNSNQNGTADVLPPDERNSGTLIAAAKPNENTGADINSNPATNTYAMHTANPENVNYVQDDEKGKRTKLGSLFRKVKRVLERTANIKTGEGLQIAGFEIAAK